MSRADFPTYEKLLRTRRSTSSRRDNPDRKDKNALRAATRKSRSKKVRLPPIEDLDSTMAGPEDFGEVTGDESRPEMPKPPLPMLDHSRPVPGHEVVAIITELDITPAQFAWIMGITRSTIDIWMRCGTKSAIWNELMVLHREALDRRTCLRELPFPLTPEDTARSTPVIRRAWGKRLLLARTDGGVTEALHRLLRDAALWKLPTKRFGSG
jgi:hypothetical protein